MKLNHLIFSLIVSITFILLIKIPIQDLVNTVVLEEYAKLIKAIVIGSFIIAGSYYAAVKFGIVDYGGFRLSKGKNYWMLFLPLIFPGILALSNLKPGCFRYDWLLVVGLSTKLIQALCEELVFRGLIIGALLKNRKNKVHFFLLFYGTIFFALAHAINILVYDVMSIITQIVYALFMGLLFAALLIRTNNVWLLGLTHGLLNFFFSICSNNTEPADVLDHYIISDYFIQACKIALIFSPVLLMCYFLMKRSKSGDGRGSNA